MLVAACGLLAVPTALDPSGTLAGPTYLVGLGLIVLALWWGTLRLRPVERGPWLLLAAAASCWLVGDLVQRVLPSSISPAGIGAPDVFWLVAYPLLALAVLRTIHARGLPADLLREIGLDVLVVATAALFVAWRLLIAPNIDSVDVPMIATLVNVAYPIGDVALFSLALTLLLSPGRHEVASLLVIACLGLTLPIDIVQAILPTMAPDFDSARLDGALLIANALLGAAAIHPDRAELTRLARLDGRQTLHRWRVVLLGTSLCSVSVLSAIPGGGGWDLPVSIVVSVFISLAVVARFYAVVRGREAAETALTYQAQHDQLTGAANRTLLMRRLSSAISPSGARPPGLGLVLVFIDLDDFKAVNDTWGHPAGDEVLKVVTGRLTALVRSTDTVARVGGDEFVVLCRAVKDADAETLGQRIRTSLRRPIPVGADQAHIGASVGVLTAIANTPGLVPLTSAEDLLRRADTAMYRAKREGGGVCMAPLVEASSPRIPSLGRGTPS
ncbi:MAG: GGDEF domain-containing protein [Lapillicoccus sp.]